MLATFPAQKPAFKQDNLVCITNFQIYGKK